MKILFIGDSIGLPHFHRFRDVVELPYGDVFPEQLRRMLCAQFPGEDILLLNQCRHANTSHTLRSGAASEVLLVRLGVLILQLGMADLWPGKDRNMPAPAPELDGQDPWISAELFSENFAGFLNFASALESLSVIVVNIPRVSEDQYLRHPSALHRTKEYNRILLKLSAQPGISLVDAYTLFDQFGPGAFGSDGIHPTRQASTVLAENIRQHIVGHESIGRCSTSFQEFS